MHALRTGVGCERIDPGVAVRRSLRQVHRAPGIDERRAEDTEPQFDARPLGERERFERRLARVDASLHGTLQQRKLRVVAIDQAPSLALADQAGHRTAPVARSLQRTVATLEFSVGSLDRRPVNLRPWTAKGSLAQRIEARQGALLLRHRLGRCPRLAHGNAEGGEQTDR